MCHYLLCQIYNKIKDESNFFYYFLFIRESLTGNLLCQDTFQILRWRESISGAGGEARFGIRLSILIQAGA